MRATPKATAVVSDYTVVLREDRLLQQWSKPVGKDAPVHEHNRLSYALDLKFQIHAVDVRFIHETIDTSLATTNQ